MQGIFVSYRRQDSQSAAGRLSDHLREHLAEVPLFRDVETIEPGADFVDSIERALKSCKVLIAVIGPRWATVTDEAGQRRLDNAGDYTRLEIATALKRSDVRVIPVLVEGAIMPGPEALPADL
ncbi:MAG: toll/interleukin-1 receptor domain-containing protein, partial [Rhodocyclaceae bacterium]|nr:toll/interleukin-1 receptor domain-containing protein [Rhodocyclaceae bacterium]